MEEVKRWGLGVGSREDGWEGEGRGVRDYNGVR